MKYIVSLLLLSACSTPMTTMQRGDSVVQCGGGTMGSIVGGKIGYNIQQSHDRDCVNDYASKGYKVVAP